MAEKAGIKDIIGINEKKVACGCICIRIRMFFGDLGGKTPQRVKMFLKNVKSFLKELNERHSGKFKEIIVVDDK
ncbi:MAG: hypothetical protein SOT09_06760 [Candidatus Borkfalkiaceae bacterium]|nr:hypothetical protein [Christensenellaceae bacterium]